MLFDTQEHIMPTYVHTHTLTTVFSIVLEAVVKDEVDVINKLHKRSNDKCTL